MFIWLRSVRVMSIAEPIAVWDFGVTGQKVICLAPDSVQQAQGLVVIDKRWGSGRDEGQNVEGRHDKRNGENDRYHFDGGSYQFCSLRAGGRTEVRPGTLSRNPPQSIDSAKERG